MRHLLTLVSLLLVGSVWADDFNFNSPRAKAAMEKYQYAQEDLLRDLEAALWFERTKGSLEEAIKIRDAIATLKQQPDAPVANAQIPAGSTQTAKNIPADAVNYKGNYYKVYNEGMPHSVAQKQCEMMGGHLARIENAAENQFLARLSAQVPSPYGKWIDGSDAEKEGIWRFSDGTRMNYFAWAEGEPNNEFSSENVPELFENGFWNDGLGGKRDRGFICEWEGDGPQASDGVFLDDLQEREFSTIYGEPGKHGEANKKAFLLYGGVKPSHALFIHPPAGGTAFVRYDINGDYKRLKTKVGLAVLGKPDGYRDSSKKSLSPVLFKVYGDDKLLWESKPIQAFGRWLDCDVSIAGVNNLRLTTEALGSNGSAHATWIMPELKPAIKNGSKQSKTRPEEPIKNLSPKHAKRVLDDANLWEGKPGVWFLKGVLTAGFFSNRVYERLFQSNRIRSALASVNGRLPTPDEMNDPPPRR